MKKIMFSDKYGLTNAVLQGRKTMTRRLANKIMVENENQELVWNGEFNPPAYKVGEVVAVAQRYETLANSGYLNEMTTPANNAVGCEFKKDYCNRGWSNKMFVRADLMPHQIRITDIKVERLRDISDEDCLCEGVLHSDKYAMPYGINEVTAPNGVFFYYSSPREAFADLIDGISGKGTWALNPFVFVYSFELVNSKRTLREL